VENFGDVLTDKLGECLFPPPNSAPKVPPIPDPTSGDDPLCSSEGRISGEGDGVELREPGGEGERDMSTSVKG